ncbi:unnamed protein product [Pleuronectes platessa]|uniref:Uncharacterized protein n=1 Tax=Pleuronectes platessa TaxID=8262 RepID=A0A9N7YDL3_PLEPL|nr:unnamed protein product [Pleuronectes platessa]
MSNFCVTRWNGQTKDNQPELEWMILVIDKHQVVHFQVSMYDAKTFESFKTDQYLVEHRANFIETQGQPCPLMHQVCCYKQTSICDFNRTSGECLREELTSEESKSNNDAFVWRCAASTESEKAKGKAGNQ